MSKYDDLLSQAWKTKTFALHDCDGTFDLKIFDFDGRNVWVDFSCSCGFKGKMDLQIVDFKEGTWKSNETGAVIVTDAGAFNNNTGEAIEDE